MNRELPNTVERRIAPGYLVTALGCFIIAALSCLLVHRANLMASDEPIAPTSDDLFRLLIALGIVPAFVMAGIILALLAVILPRRRRQAE